MTKLMIYGATDYSGGMASTNAKALGLDPVLGGGTRSETQLRNIAEKLDAECRLFDIEDDAATISALAGIGVLLNCAGPFKRTASPLMRACIAAGVHYLDIAAEFDSYRRAEELDGEAEDAGVMLLPGSGGSIATLGSVARHKAERVWVPTRLQIVLQITGRSSRGSVAGSNEDATTAALHREDGMPVPRGMDEARDFDFGNGPTTTLQPTFPDRITIWRCTGIADIGAYGRTSEAAFPEADLAAIPNDPHQAVVEVTSEDGPVARSVLDMAKGYSLTAIAAVETARRVLNGGARPGFQTMARLYGDDFAQTIADMTTVDL